MRLKLFYTFTKAAAVLRLVEPLGTESLHTIIKKQHPGPLIAK